MCIKNTIYTKIVFRKLIDSRLPFNNKINHTQNFVFNLRHVWLSGFLPCSGHIVHFYLRKTEALRNKF